MKGFYPHSGVLGSQGCMAKTKIWQKLMWRLQPKAIKVEVWSHLGAIFPHFSFTMESDLSSLGLWQRQKRTEWKQLEQSELELCRRMVQLREFLQPVILRLPDSEAMQGHSAVPQLLLLHHNTCCQHKTAPPGRKCFAPLDFCDWQPANTVDAHVHRGVKSFLLPIH